MFCCPVAGIHDLGAVAGWKLMDELTPILASDKVATRRDVCKAHIVLEQLLQMLLGSEASSMSLTSSATYATSTFKLLYSSHHVT